MLRKISVKVCDVCKATPENIKEVLVTRTCSVCEKVFCDDTKHNGDTYYTTEHMGGYGEKKMVNFICKTCWKLSEYFGYKNGTTRLPHDGIDLHTSGSSTAINMAEYREAIESKAKEMSERYLIEMLKAVKAGIDVSLDVEKSLSDIEQVLQAEKEELILKKKKEVLGII